MRIFVRAVSHLWDHALLKHLFNEDDTTRLADVVGVLQFDARPLEPIA